MCNLTGKARHILYAVKRGEQASLEDVELLVTTILRKDAHIYNLRDDVIHLKADIQRLLERKKK